MATKYRNSGQLTDEERAVQLQHVLRKLETALDYVVAQARDTLTFGEMPWTSTKVHFQLPGVALVKIKVNLEVWVDDTLTVHISATQLDGEGYYSSLIPRDREKFEKLFQKYNPKRMTIDDDGLRTVIFLPAVPTAA